MPGEQVPERYRRQLLREFLRYLDRHGGTSEELADFMADSDSGEESVLDDFLMRFDEATRGDPVMAGGAGDRAA